MGNELFDESHFFYCTGGLKPARFKAGQKTYSTEDGNFYLTKNSLTCKGIDFSCKYAALIAAIVAAALVLLLSNPGGWVVLAALGAAVGGAIVGAGIGFAICGCMAASFREWIPITWKDESNRQYVIEGFIGVANRPGDHLTCSAWFGQRIYFVPNVKSELAALGIFAANIFTTGLQGFMIAYAFRGGGLLVKGKIGQFLGNLAVNWIRSWSVSGVAMRGVFGWWGGESSYYLSRVEGENPEAIDKAQRDGFLFFEMAVYRLASAPFGSGSYDKEVYNIETDQFETTFNWEGLLNDVSMILGFGGTPAGADGKDVNSAKEVGNAALSTIEGWENPVETVKNDVINLYKTAKQVKEKISKFANGRGAVENMFSVEKLLDNPKEIWNKTPEEIAKAFNEAGYEATIEPSTKGSKLSTQIRIKGHPEITNIQVHPGGGRHGGSYYKISTSTQGKFKVVNPETYKATPDEKVTIIEVRENKPTNDNTNNTNPLPFQKKEEEEDEDK